MMIEVFTLVTIGLMLNEIGLSAMSIFVIGAALIWQTVCVVVAFMFAAGIWTDDDLY